MKIYQKHYVYDSIFPYKMRELKDVGEELYNLNINYYLIIVSKNKSRLVTINVYNLSNVRLFTRVFINDEYLIKNIKAIVGNYT